LNFTVRASKKSGSDFLPDGTVEDELYDARHDTRNCHDDAISVIAQAMECRHPHHAGLPILPHFS